MSFAHLPDPGWVPLDIPFISSGRTYIPAVSKPTIPEIKRTIPAIPVTQPTIPETKPITDEIKKKIAQWIPTAANANIGLAVLWIVGLILGIATIAKYKKGKAINQNDYKISASIYCGDKCVEYNIRTILGYGTVWIPDKSVITDLEIPVKTLLQKNGINNNQIPVFAKSRDDLKKLFETNLIMYQFPTSGKLNIIPDSNRNIGKATFDFNKPQGTGDFKLVSHDDKDDKYKRLFWIQPSVYLKHYKYGNVWMPTRYTDNNESVTTTFDDQTWHLVYATNLLDINNADIIWQPGPNQQPDIEPGDEIFWVPSHGDQQGGSFPASLKDIIPDFSNLSLSEMDSKFESLKATIPGLPEEIKQLHVSQPDFLPKATAIVNKYAPHLLDQLKNQLGGEVNNLAESTRTARRPTVEEASNVLCAEEQRFRSHLLQNDTKWVCKDAACKEWGIKENGKIMDIDKNIINAQCNALGLGDNCESTLKSCSTAKIDDCYRILVDMGNKFGGYGCGEKRDAIMKVSPGLVRDILMHMGFKIVFRRNISKGIDVLAFESLPEFIAHSSEALKVRLESSKLTNLTSFLKLMVEWANAHPDMLNNALVKPDIKSNPAQPLKEFIIREKSILPGSEPLGYKGVIGELSRLGHQRTDKSPYELMNYFRNVSGFQQMFNPEMFGDVRMGRVQLGGTIEKMLEYRSNDAAIFGSIIDEIRKMLASKYNIDLSSNSQQRVQQKLDSFKMAEKELDESIIAAIDRERVLKITNNQIDLDLAGPDREKLLEHYMGMSKLLDTKNRRANTLIKVIQSMLQTSIDH